LFDDCGKVTTFRSTFYGVPLTSIPLGLFDYCTLVETFSYCFGGNNQLTGIPSGLFDNCPEVTDFSYCFVNCNNTGFTSIPSGLFDYCTKVLTFHSCFSGCNKITAIPSGLYDNCTLVTTYYRTHYANTSITSAVPELWNLDPEPTGTQCFYNCTNASNYGDIPVDWK
jgi:hypothetical protein